MDKSGKYYLMKALSAVICIYLIIMGCYMVYRYHDQAGKNKKAVKIGISVYKASDTFISVIISDIENVVKEYEQDNNIKVDLDISDAKENQSLQNDQIEKYIKLNYDVICVNIVDRTTASVIIDKAVAADIPIIFFNREPVKEDIFRGKKVYYVGSDAKKSAILQGDLIVNTYKKNPGKIDLNGDGIIKYVMLEGEMGHQDALIRTEWSVQTLKDCGLSIAKVTGGIANFQRNQAAALMKEWLDKYGNEIELVICNNDDMALGACDAIEKSKYKNINVVGIDGTPAGLAAVKSGKMLGTVLCNTKGHAEAIFGLAYSLATNGKADETVKLENERYIRVQLETITKEELMK